MDRNLKLDFESSRNEWHAVLVRVTRAALDAGPRTPTSFHVLGFVRLVFNLATVSGFRSPRAVELDESELADEFYLGRTAIRSVISRALSTGIVTRSTIDERGARRRYRYTVDLAAIRRLAGFDVREANNDVRLPNNNVREANNDVREANNQEELSSRVSSRGSCNLAPTDRTTGAVCEDRVEEIRREANRIKTAGPLPTRSPDDRALVLTAATLLVDGKLAPDQVEQAIESVQSKKPRNRAAWFRSCLVNGAKRAGDDWHALEAAADLPAELVERKRQGELLA